MNYEETTFSTDVAAVTFHDDADGITVDDDGEASFDWDEVERVTVDEPPIPEAFDSKQFYRLPATVARPIPQPYSYQDSTYWLKKPREELKRAAWSLDNAPWTMGHPDTGMVKNVDDIRGFWGNPRYIDSLDDLDADLHVPVGDEEARSFIEENGDVSVGFYNRNVRTDNYDGVVGDADDGSVDLDGYQVDMYFDHCASVQRGRCPGDKGCGLDGVGDEHGHMSFISGTRTTLKGRKDGDGTVSSTDATNPDDDKWYAVPPSDNPDDEYKFPINNCSDVQDAWKLRGHGDLSISQETLESRIKSRARDLDCEVPGDEEQDTIELDGDSWYQNYRDDDMTSESQDCDCEPNTDEPNMNFDLDFSDLTPEAVLEKVAAEHDGVSELVDELRAHKETAEAAEEAADELDLDEVSQLPKRVGLIEDELEELRAFKADYEEEEMREHAKVIAERTDRFGEDTEDVLDSHEDLEDIEETRDLVEELAEEAETSEQTANPSADEGTPDANQGRRSKYRATPWD